MVERDQYGEMDVIVTKDDVEEIPVTSYNYHSFSKKDDPMGFNKENKK